MNGGEEVENKKRTGLVVVLGVLIAAIIGLIVGVVAIKMQEKNSVVYDEFLSELSQRMPNYDYEDISDETKARLFDNMIRNKLKDNLDYNVEDAVSDYGAMYNTVSGDLKLYIAMGYAAFVKEEANDVSKAINIMLEVEEMGKDNIGYYAALSDYYKDNNDEEKSNYYLELVKDIVRTSEMYTERNGNEVSE